jgi:hypothetical protein
MSDAGIKEKAKRPRGNAVQERLVTGEEAIASAVIHNGIYWKAAAVAIIGVLLGIFVWELGLLLLFVAALMGLYAHALKNIYLLVITNKRILVRYGLLQVEVVDIHFDKVESIELERMPTGYIMGYSNVVIMGTGNRYIVIPYVANGPELRRAYNELTLARK